MPDKQEPKVLHPFVMSTYAEPESEMDFRPHIVKHEEPDPKASSPAPGSAESSKPAEATPPETLDSQPKATPAPAEKETLMPVPAGKLPS